MQSELSKKLAKLIGEELKEEEQSVKDLVLFLLNKAIAKQDIVSMTNAVKGKLDEEIEKLYSNGLLDYDEDDESFDVI